MNEKLISSALPAMLFAITCVPAFSAPAPIDLTSWEQRGNPGSGSWNVSGDGLSVTQTINGGPTFFVSPNSSLDRTLQGKFSVSDSDDDFVGFVFGFSEPDADQNSFDFLLFDWKKSDQVETGTNNPALEGFTLSRVLGEVANIPPDSTGSEGFWSHTHPAMTVLASSYGANLGWENNTTYDFALLYQSDRIKIDINGSTVFDVVGGNNPDGSFGFYDFSQRNVTYQEFSVVPLPAAFWAFGSALLCLVALKKR